MGTIANLFVKFSGLGWIWTALDGWKTYIAAAIAILTGLAGLLQELAPILAAHNAGGVLAFVQGLPKDQAWLTLVGGVGMLGLRHSVAKSAAQ